MWIPFCWPVAKDTDHLCSTCGDQLGTKMNNLDFLNR